MVGWTEDLSNPPSLFELTTSYPRTSSRSDHVRTFDILASSFSAATSAAPDCRLPLGSLAPVSISRFLVDADHDPRFIPVRLMRFITVPKPTSDIPPRIYLAHPICYPLVPLTVKKLTGLDRNSRLADQGRGQQSRLTQVGGRMLGSKPRWIGFKDAGREHPEE